MFEKYCDFFIRIVLSYCLLLFAPVSLNAADMAASAVAASDGGDFLTHHWPKGGLPLQGRAPEGFSSLEGSLHPEKCGVCHPQQFQDWSGSRHALARGGGVLEQVIPLLVQDPDSAQSCFRCHTPLAEQQNQRKIAGEWQSNTHFDASLQAKGLVCAGCHVRQWQRFGPPRQRTPEAEGSMGKGVLPHNGFTADKTFTSSEFCKNCHQFDSDGYALNGKLLENTYQEWKDSEYAAQGVQCQHCHMPERRHLWRGIHDKAMVRDSIDVRTVLNQRHFRAGDALTAKIMITNKGAGHHFPTYVTPQVVVRAYLVDAQGQRQKDSQQTFMIGRALSDDLSAELYDTRIPAGDSLTMHYTQRVAAERSALRIEIDVEPDHFYEGFFRSFLATAKGSAREAMQKALLITQQSPYRVYEQAISLTDIPVTMLFKDSERPKNIQPSLQKTNKKKPHALNSQHSRRVDWNDTALHWYDYEAALRLAKATHRPILFILYANWCAVCHAYSAVFYNESVIATVATNNVILARANVEEVPELSLTFDLDGEYVPRTFLLNEHGDVMEAAYGNRTFPRYFIPADAYDDFSMLLQSVDAE